MGKFKVVPVEQETPVEIPQPEVKEESPPPSEPEVKSEPVAEPLANEAPAEESKPDAKKEPSMISCEKWEINAYEDIYI